MDDQAPYGIEPLVMTDEEGGGVQRVANLVGSLPWPATMSATMTTTQIRQLADQTASAMRENGVTVDLAPVLDLASGPGPDATHTDGPRSFGPDSTTTTQDGLAFAQGLEAGGVLPVVKHFPGEGSATANTDDAPANTPPLATLEGADLLPFEAAIRAGLPAVMVGNASVPGLSSTPASLSPAVIDGLLRQRLGFQGLVLTDSLSADAITAEGLSVPDAAVQAIEAGADMVLFTADDPNATTQSVVAAIVAAVTAGGLSVPQLDSAVSHVLMAKGVSLC
jgi:beta-N-acetylhexosaminidase